MDLHGLRKYIIFLTNNIETEEDLLSSEEELPSFHELIKYEDENVYRTHQLLEESIDRAMVRVAKRASRNKELR